MKIVHVIDYFQPQLGYQESELAKHQAEAGHEVTVLTSDRYYPFANYEKSFGNVLGDRIIGVGESHVNGYKIIRLKPKVEKFGQTIIPEIYELLLKIKPEIVFHHNFLKPDIHFTLRAKKKLHFKLIIDNHTGSYNASKNSIFKSLYFLTWKTIIKRRITPDINVVSTGKNEQEHLLKTLGIESKIIPLGADTIRFKPSADLRFKIRSKLNIKENELLLIHSGKFAENKKTLELVRAFKNLVRSHQNIKLLLLGSGETNYQQKLDREIHLFENNILKHEMVNNKELPAFLNASDIGVWPGARSLTFYEALSVGLPLILSKSDFSEDVLSNENGIMVRDYEELLAAMEKLITHNPLRKSMAVNSRKLAEQKYNWKKISEQFIDLAFDRGGKEN